MDDRSTLTPNRGGEPPLGDAERSVLRSVREAVVVAGDRSDRPWLNDEAIELLGPEAAELPLACWPERLGLVDPRMDEPFRPEDLPFLPAADRTVDGPVELHVAAGEDRPARRLVAHPALVPGREAGGDRVVVTVIRDLTRSRRIQDALRENLERTTRRERRDRALAGLMRVGRSAADRTTVCERGTEAVIQGLGCDAACVMLVPPEGGPARTEATIIASRAPGAGDRPADAEAGGLTARILRTGAPFQSAGGQTGPFDLGGMLPGLPVEGACAAPVADGEEILGVVYALDRRARERDQQDLEILKSVGRWIAEAVIRERLDEQRRRSRAELERQVEERTASLEHSMRQLQMSERLASLGTMAAGLGHDMANVLLPIRCRLDALGAAPDPDADATQSTLEAVRHGVDFLQELSEGLRLLARDPADAAAGPASTSLPLWWSRVHRLLEHSLPEQTSLVVDLAPGIPPIQVAGHRLTQAVLNLLVNAGEAMPEGGAVTLRARPGPEPDTAEISVRDEGVGIDEGIRERIFDPFFSTRTRGVSTGLGLALVHGIVEGAGGRIDVESTPGEGTTFTLTLPTERESGPPETPARPLAVVRIRDPRTRAWVEALLDARGHEVIESGELAANAADLMVVDADPADRSAAEAFMQRSAGRRLVVLGRPDGGWADLDPVVVEDPGDLDAIRDAVAGPPVPATGPESET